MAKAVGAGNPKQKKPQIASVSGALRTKLLEEMRQNPKGNWSIEDVAKLCRQVGLEFKPPRRGSHHKAFSKCCDGMLTIPANKPIKPVYIRYLVALADAHIQKAGEV